jgi:hypothetical protein
LAPLRTQGRSLSAQKGGGDLGEVTGCVLRDGGTRAAGPERFRIVEDCPHDFDVAGVAQAFKRDLVSGGDGAGEVGADDDAVKVAEHEQRRVGQRVAVEQALVEGRVEILVFAFVLPAEKA